MDIWNDSSLLSPPLNTYKSNDCPGDILQLHTVISDAIYALDNQKLLHREAALISRLIYLMGRKFRHDIGYSYVKRTNAALLKYLNLKFSIDLQSFYSVIPCTASYSYLPTRQMLEFVLIRMQTFSSIMHRVITCAKKAAIHFFDRLKKCENAWLSLMPFSILSRIWKLSKYLLDNSCKWYNTLYNFKGNLKIVGAPFLPDGYIFPCDLTEWLGYDSSDGKTELELNSYLTKINTNSIKSDLCDLIESDSEENDVEQLDNFTKNFSVSYPVKVTQKSEWNDPGERVSRQEFKQLQPPCLNTKPIVSEIKQNNSNTVSSKLVNHDKSKLSNEDNNNESFTRIKQLISKKVNRSVKKDHQIHHKHSIETAISLKKLNSFLQTEDLYRTNNDSNSLTNGLGLMQWQALKNILVAKMKKMERISDGKKQSFNKIHKIWAERCPKLNGLS